MGHYVVFTALRDMKGGVVNDTSMIKSLDCDAKLHLNLYYVSVMCAGLLCT